MTFSNALTRMFGLEHPIIQAPMAGVSTPELPAAELIRVLVHELQSTGPQETAPVPPMLPS